MIIPIFISDKTADAVGGMIDEVLGDVPLLTLDQFKYQYSSAGLQ